MSEIINPWMNSICAIHRESPPGKSNRLNESRMAVGNNRGVNLLTIRHLRHRLLQSRIVPAEVDSRKQIFWGYQIVTIPLNSLDSSRYISVTNVKRIQHS